MRTKRHSLYLVLCFSLLVVTSTTADWPMFQGNPQHNGYAPVQGPIQGNQTWSSIISSGINPLCGPSVGQYRNGTKIVVGANDGIHIFDVQGVETEFVSTSHPIETVVTIYDDTLFFGDGDSLIAHRAGSRRWTAIVDIPILSMSRIQVTPFSTTLYITDESHIRAFSLDGTQIWERSLLGICINSGPAVDELNTISVLTSRDPNSSIEAPEFTVYAFDSEGDSLWSYEHNISVTGSVGQFPTSDDDGNVFVATRWNTGLLNTMQSVAGATPNWTVDAANGTQSSPAYRRGQLYYGTRDGLETRQSVNGYPLWANTAYGPVTFSSPVLDNTNSVYFGTDLGWLVAQRTDGFPRWGIQLNGPLGSPALGNDGTLYICDPQHLYAFRPGAPTYAPQEEVVDQVLRVWPNPATFSIHVQSSREMSGFARLNVFDVKGRHVRTLGVNRVQSQWTSQHSLGGLASGMYFIQLTIAEDRYMHQFVVVR